ncbi:MAG: ccpA 2 [Candidatus Brocadiaceae bacterium]|nr:ccpA 2 [Candidatus Brocadiaceae bacterium]
MRTIQNKLFRWAFAGVCAVAFCLIHSRISPGETQGKDAPVDTRKLWKLITVESPYQDYPSWPGKEGFYDSTMPPGNMLKLYVNDFALETILYKKG